MAASSPPASSSVFNVSTRSRRTKKRQWICELSGVNHLTYSSTLARFASAHLVGARRFGHFDYLGQAIPCVNGEKVGIRRPCEPSGSFVKARPPIFAKQNRELRHYREVIEYGEVLLHQMFVKVHATPLCFEPRSGLAASTATILNASGIMSASGSAGFSHFMLQNSHFRLPQTPIISVSSLTASADFLSAACSSAVSLISTICSMPRAPSLAGTPTNNPLIPYSPSR